MIGIRELPFSNLASFSLKAAEFSFSLDLGVMSAVDAGVALAALVSLGCQVTSLVTNIIRHKLKVLHKCIGPFLYQEERNIQKL